MVRISFLVLSEQGSNSFNKFLTLLGDRIKLKGWDKFKAGLDVKSKISIFFFISQYRCCRHYHEHHHHHNHYHHQQQQHHNKKLPTSVCYVFLTFPVMYSRLSLSRNRRDPQKHFEISVLRHIRFVVLRKKQYEQPIFSNDYVI